MATVGFGDFEWDEDKARSNLEKHGVSFEEASSVFLDPDFMAIDDPTAPDRFIALGFSRLARVLSVVHLEAWREGPNHQRTTSQSLRKKNL